ncbi:spore germination protein [Paenibacillus piri]|uniref:Uncharacterized protein n=1 Tax=Paenibacillus piri TaxID=2547395 RepID=A0A4R5KSG3_9BACL|nr:spore germination protein [Paenibacillus piri]TDF97978.1 hypothetical protein E1757_10690 [Paenibacillus piri]
MFNDCDDAVFHEISVRGTVQAIIVYLHGLTDTAQLDLRVLKPLQEVWKEEPQLADFRDNFAVSDITEAACFNDLVVKITSGEPVLLVQGHAIGYAFGLSKWEKRSPEESKAESVVRGTREGFTETIGTNMALLRRRLKEKLCGGFGHFSFSCWNTLVIPDFYGRLAFNPMDDSLIAAQILESIAL